MGFTDTLQVYVTWSWVSLSDFTVHVILNLENSFDWIDWCLGLKYSWCIALTIWPNWPSTIAKVSSCLWGNV